MAESLGRNEMLDRLAALVLRRSKPSPLVIAIDGIDCAGKSTLADELGHRIESSGVPVLRASVDGFHNPAAVRHLRSAETPARSYYEDSFDYGALCHLLLDPLGPDGDHIVRTRVFDYVTDTVIHEPPLRVEPTTAVLFDGVFLLRPELAPYWDLSMFVEIATATCLRRAVQRDAELFGTNEAAARRYRQRYLPGQELYLSAVRPQQRADVLIGNNNPAAPILRRIPHT